MNKHIIILALETLLEQLVDSRDYSDDNRAKIGYVMDEMNRLKSPATAEDKARWLTYTLDMEAEEMFGEFGFDTLDGDEKFKVFKELFKRDLLT